MGRRRSLPVAAAIAVAALAALLVHRAYRGKLYDLDFDPRVEEPANRGAIRPRVLIDEAHRNAHTAGGSYKPFADLLANDGYDVQPLREPIAMGRLSGASVLVIAGARGSNDANDAAAFTDAEVAEVERWVRSGGSLLLVTDHWPFGPAAESLAQRFGVEMGKGMVEDPEHFEASLGESHVVFSRDNELLRDHAITSGRTPAERIRRVLSFTGQSLGVPPDAFPFLALGEAARDWPPTAPQVERAGGDVRVSMSYGEPVPARGRAQGVALEWGRGRVVVPGEAGMLSAQRGRDGAPVGMNFPGYDNRQLVLNLMHWLSRLL